MKLRYGIAQPAIAGLLFVQRTNQLIVIREIIIRKEIILAWDRK